MTKKFNVDAIANELEQSAFFRKPEPEQAEASKPSPLPNSQANQEKEAQKLTTGEPVARPPDDTANRRGDRPTGKGLLVRRGFEYREDQLRALKQLSLKEQLEGKEGSMSKMVREALDDYLKKRANEH